MTTLNDCTLPEKILLAAGQLNEAGHSPFSAEALIVDAWRKYPRTFGLKGFADQYPDSNKVLASIMGERGLIGRGWLTKMGQKLYALTPAGQQMIRRLRQEEGPAKPVKGQLKLSADHDALLQALLTSSAYEKLREDRKQEMTFADACRFWNITENLQPEALDARLEAIARALTAIERKIGEGKAILRTGQEVVASDILRLVDLGSYLQDRFHRHLTLLRSRAERQ